MRMRSTGFLRLGEEPGPGAAALIATARLPVLVARTSLPPVPVLLSFMFHGSETRRVDRLEIDEDAEGQASSS